MALQVRKADKKSLIERRNITISDVLSIANTTHDLVIVHLMSVWAHDDQMSKSG